MNCLKRFVIFCIPAFFITFSIESSAQPIAFAGNLDFIGDDLGGGVYSGVPLGTFFTGSIDPLTGGGEISDGTTSTTFACCIAAGGLSIGNDDTLDAETAALLNQLSGTSSFFAGQILDSVDIEGDVATAANGRIEVGLSYILSSDSFSDSSPDNYPFDPSKVLLSVFFITEEDEDGEDIYTAIGLLRDVIPATERDALLSLFASAGGATWDSNLGWDPSPASVGTECSWAGVTCSGSRVVALNLMTNNLAGTIPPELGNLTSLELLWLAFNNLTGSIPSELGGLSMLAELNLSSNQLSGSIPGELGSLNVDELSLGDNQLTGAIPSELGNMPSIEFLELDNNQLSGSIPTELGLLDTPRLFLRLSNNNLTGAIPAQLGNIATLRQLDVSFNQLAGPIPAELANPADLELLWVNDNQLTGQIPQALLDDQDLDFNFANNPGLSIGDPEPDPPPAKITLNSDGSPTTAMVSGGITKDGGDTYISEFQVGDTIQILVRLEPETSDIGITSEIFVVAVAGPASLLVTPGGLITWDGQLGSLVPFDEIVLAAENEFNILQPFGGEFTLTSAETGSYAFFIGYTVGGGVITYNTEPLELVVTE